MTFNQIHYALVLARTKNFTQAADELFITQPTLSQQIKAIECELGTTLFFRDRRHVSLTESGRVFLEHARFLWDEWSRCRDHLLQHRSEERGNLKVGFLWTFGYIHLDRAMEQFQSLHPGIRIQLSIDGSRALLRRIHSGQLDLAFVTFHTLNKISRDPLHSIPVHTSPMMAIVSRNHPLSSKEFLTPEDLKACPLMLPSPKSNLFVAFQSLFHQSEDLNIVGYSSQADALIQTARSNLAIGFLSQSAASSYDIPDICAIPFHPTVTRTIHMVYHKTNPNPQIPVFEDFIGEFYQR
ncbi:LysR family transcriptional regulator [Peptoniphilaceae bacterium SGI.137]|nr:LysR family transcriptional regulator [Peptoniphilaceae bacterium]MDY4195985.1 LysR family transcriptional regulator [Peptoniphilaceae bacterium]